jgi:NAD(P)-dependent dehydrogenase (short-subunit alcohol dehydrogenase family)
MLVENKIAVITGGASGIGKATVIRYAEEGAKVVVADVDESGGRETVERVADAGGEVTFTRTDVSDADDVQAMIETAVSEYGGIDVLFNNAGIEGPCVELTEVEEDEFDQVVSINQKGVFLGLKYGIEAMLADGGGSIVNTSSVAADTGLPGRAAYASTKAAVNGLTRVAALEYAKDDIRVNSLLPGIVRTPMLRRTAEEEPTERVTQYELSEAMSGMGKPEDLANAALLLGSHLTSRITGVTLPVDGGFLTRP